MSDLYSNFNLYRQARSIKERALSKRHGNSFGIACDTDEPSLEWQAADCIERVTEDAIFHEAGRSTEIRCHYCGSYIESCYCDILAKRGIDTHNIRIEDGYIHFKKEA